MLNIDVWMNFGFFAVLRESAGRGLFFGLECSCGSIRLEVEGRLGCHEDTLACFSNSSRSSFVSRCTCNKCNKDKMDLFVQVIVLVCY